MEEITVIGAGSGAEPSGADMVARMFGGRHPENVHVAYCQYGLASTAGPVVVSVPHAGREYPTDLVARAKTGPQSLRALEDRHADALTEEIVKAGHVVLIARRARAEIDLNRHPLEIDAAAVSGIPRDAPTRSSVKLRGGLGLVPHHYHAAGDLWRRRTTFAEVKARLKILHAPYHARLEHLLAVAHSRHGVAILLDLHSMPPIGGGSPQIVIGDRFGQSARSGLAEFVADILRIEGVTVAINAPYSGGHVLERHGQPDDGRHAIQIEIDRSLYLDAALDRPGPGLTRWRRVLARLVSLLNDAATGPRAAAMAAE